MSYGPWKIIVFSWFHWTLNFHQHFQIYKGKIEYFSKNKICSLRYWHYVCQISSCYILFWKSYQTFSNFGHDLPNRGTISHLFHLYKVVGQQWKWSPTFKIAVIFCKTMKYLKEVYINIIIHTIPMGNDTNIIFHSSNSKVYRIQIHIHFNKQNLTLAN